MSEEIPPTEQRNPASRNLAELDASTVISLMTEEEYRVLTAIEQVVPRLSTAAEHVASAFISGGRIVFIGAGTSGRIALQEVAELPPTFGVPAEIFVVLAAGGQSTGPTAITQTEDDVEAAPRALKALHIDKADVVIGIAASGTTPFVRSGLQAAAGLGAWTCAIANNPYAPMFDDDAFAIFLDTGPEILTGSTRLKAGTAQKLALNRITTAAMVLAGRVVENHMVDLSGSNAKFRQRSVRIIMDLAGVDANTAIRLLEGADWSVRRALGMP